MAVHKITNNDEFVCDSSDVKPTPVGVGARITELNTGLKFIYDGANWIEDLTLYAAVKMALEDAA